MGTDSDPEQSRSPTTYGSGFKFLGKSQIRSRIRLGMNGIQWWALMTRLSLIR